MADGSERRSRRSVLTATMGGVVAAAAGALGRPAAARAANGDNVLLGGANVATAQTAVKNLGGNALRGASHAGIGLYGTSRDAAGVSGFSLQGDGVVGQTQFGAGVSGSSEFGSGVQASSSGGVALDVLGHVRFSWSGVAIIPAGETSVVFDVGFGEDSNVYPSSFVLLTPKDDLDGRSLWYTTNPNAGRFGIHIGSARTSPTRIAWLLAN